MGASHRAGADQLVALLGPDTAAAGEHPRRPGLAVVGPPAHDGGVAVGGQRDGQALAGASNSAGADQLVALLGPDTAAAGEHPRRPARHPPTMAVLPSADSATDMPWPSGNGASPAPPVPTSLLPCCVQTSPLRVNTHAAPVVLLSLGPPTMAVLPSADSATDAPWDHKPPPYSLVVPTSLSPCCVQTPPLRVNTHAAPSRPDQGRPIAISVVGAGSTHDGGVAVRGQRDGHALVGASHRVGADQLRPLLEGLRRRVALATPLPRALSFDYCPGLRVARKTGLRR